jgi:hypothetical protein
MKIRRSKFANSRRIFFGELFCELFWRSAAPIVTRIQLGKWLVYKGASAYYALILSLRVSRELTGNAATILLHEVLQKFVGRFWIKSTRFIWRLGELRDSYRIGGIAGFEEPYYVRGAKLD